MVHAEKLINSAIGFGKDVKAQFESDLKLELDSRALFEQILADEEELVDHLEGILHAIGEVGLDNFLSQQIHKSE
jgi:bacterioferritin (cytochrome b1)